MAFVFLFIVSVASCLIVVDATDVMIETVNDEDFAESGLDDFKADTANSIDVEEAAPNHPCPEAWTRLGSRCFRFFGEEKNWQGAAATCKNNGGHLASIHSAQENDRLFKMWKSLAKKATYDTRTAYWIGFTDSASEGRFQWQDGTRVDYRNWYAGEPNNYEGNEDCTVVWNKGSAVTDKQKWNDDSCTRKYSFVCSK